MRLFALLLGAVWSPIVACGAATPGAREAGVATAPSSPSAVPAVPEKANPSAPPTAAAPPDAAALHAQSIVVDTHDDVPQLLVAAGADLGASLADAQTDIPRMRTGGLDAEFLSVW